MEPTARYQLRHAEPEEVLVQLSLKDHWPEYINSLTLSQILSDLRALKYFLDQAGTGRRIEGNSFDAQPTLKIVSISYASPLIFNISITASIAKFLASLLDEISKIRGNHHHVNQRKQAVESIQKALQVQVDQENPDVEKIVRLGELINTMTIREK